MIGLSIVIPLYNEEESLFLMCQRLNSLFPELKKQMYKQGSGKEDADIEVLFINDGSTDNSLSILNSIVKNDNTYRYISFSRNFGHQPAVSAGLQYAKGNAVVIMDCDLQDPPELIKDMIGKWKEGFDVVYAVRRKRQSNFFKKIAYKLYYIFNFLLSDQPVQKDSGDFSLLDRKIVDIINKLPEKDRYIRGLRAWVGFRQADLPYDRVDRKSGKSKYSFHSLVKLAFQGALSTSVKPLLISGFFSIVSILIALCLIIWALFAKIYVQQDLMPKGWASLMVVVALLSGFQLLSLWIQSLYIAKIYREVVSRPTYIIEQDSLAKNNKRKED